MKTLDFCAKTQEFWQNTQTCVQTLNDFPQKYSNISGKFSYHVCPYYTEKNTALSVPVPNRVLPVCKCFPLARIRGAKWGADALPAGNFPIHSC